MAGQRQLDKMTGFKTIILFKDQYLGIGSFGAVCKAKCDDLLCAAKIIHSTLSNVTAPHQTAPHRLPIRRFQLECEFLSTIRHPNIVQYLGTHQDPNTHELVLLMELMDDSLTHFLEAPHSQSPTTSKSTSLMTSPSLSPIFTLMASSIEISPATMCY